MSNDPDDSWFDAWEAAGFGSAQVAKPWKSRGFEPEEARLWYELDVMGLAEAHVWKRLGFDASEAGNWIANGFTFAPEAAEWKSRFDDPSTAKGLRRRGVRAGSIQYELISQGTDPEHLVGADLDGLEIDQVATWLNAALRHGGVLPSRLGMWIREETAPFDAVSWDRRAVDHKVVAGLLGRGWSSNIVDLVIHEWGDDAREFRLLHSEIGALSVLNARASIPAAKDLVSWLNAKFEVNDAVLWMNKGVVDPKIAVQWSALGCSPRSVSRWRKVDIQSPLDAKILIESNLQIGSVELMVGIGLNAREILGWCRVRTFNPGEVDLLLRALGNSTTLDSWRDSGIDVLNWPSWILRVSRDPHECETWHALGATPFELEVLDDAQRRLKMEALVSERALFAQSGLQHATSRDQRRNPSVHSVVPFAGDHGFRDLPDEEWLEEIQAKAVLLGPDLKKSPQWPLQFEDKTKRYFVRILSADEFVSAVVCLGRDIFETNFDTKHFEPLIEPRSALERLALGLAISWFIDCTVVLTRQQMSSRVLFETESVGRTTDALKIVKYVPTPQYRSAVRAVRNGFGVSPALHEVVGHVRRLPPGHMPSESARANAPAFVRRRLKARETYVSPHVRGQSGVREEYASRLSALSSLAHAVAFL